MWTATVDFTKAFGSITHKSIWKALKSCNIDHDYISLLRKIYRDQKASVQTDEERNIFEIRKGTKQGDPLSSLLINAPECDLDSWLPTKSAPAFAYCLARSSHLAHLSGTVSRQRLRLSLVIQPLRPESPNRRRFHVTRPQEQGLQRQGLCLPLRSLRIFAHFLPSSEGKTTNDRLSQSAKRSSHSSLECQHDLAPYSKQLEHHCGAKQAPSWQPVQLHTSHCSRQHQLRARCWRSPTTGGTHPQHKAP